MYATYVIIMLEKKYVDRYVQVYLLHKVSVVKKLHQKHLCKILMFLIHDFVWELKAESCECNF